ncbi:MAG TPA: acyl carrier protein [Holophagaceae bacterium]|nr:acyl carrier protein [Holophagaceae bacterium]
MSAVADRAAIRVAVLRELKRLAPEADLARLEADAPLRRALDLDSVDFLNLILALHRATGIEVPEQDYPALATVDGCVAYFAGRLGL